MEGNRGGIGKLYGTEVFCKSFIEGSLGLPDVYLMPHMVQAMAYTRLEDWQLKLALSENFPDGPAVVS